ncbi:hypothetical protein PQX77_013159 [Marasmius sp. AFHP31]|nr:hypothetical protein PQX77_013159 [Marasmius sp. AFHP31]
MFSHFFQNARKFRITGGSFVQVQGDQINNTTTIVQVKEKEQTELDEYFEVKRGAIYRVRENGSYKYPRRWDNGDREWGEEERLRADRTIHAAELVDRPGKVFTVVEYTGPEAKKAFEDDFAMLIRNLRLNAAQMYGYNLSAIPSILLYNELVPAAQVNAGIIGKVYLKSLYWWQLCCEPEEMWLDPGKGVFCRGPPGPRLDREGLYFGDEVQLPLTAELIQEDVLLRFLAALKSKDIDDVVISGVAFSGASTIVPEGVLRPTVISTLTNTPIAIANSFWESCYDSLSDRKLLGNGMVRFTLNSGRYLRLVWSSRAQEGWMAQAWSIFSTRGISLEEDLSAYQLIYRYASLSDYALNYSVCRQAQQPIYLFIRPAGLPDLEYGNTPSLHYWSFDEAGHSTLSDDLYNDFGLPKTLHFFQYFMSRSWSNDAYSCSRQYQLLRGFDPSTTDFARSLGYDHRLFHPLSNSDRFAQVNQEPPLEDGASALAAHVPTTEDLITAHPTRLLHGFGAITIDFARHARVGDHVSQPVNDPNRFEHVQEDSECEPPTSVGSKTSASGAQSTGILSALLSPLSSTLSNDSDILTIGF